MKSTIHNAIVSKGQAIGQPGNRESKPTTKSGHQLTSSPIA
ncbi:hypothetical protein [Limnothrix sp. FACHB-708]|nr:hypothetical protein [Limnothrix sp. FACHB-708]